MTQHQGPQEAIRVAIQRSRAGVPALSDLDLEVAVTPKDVVHTNGTLRLYHYHSVREEVYRTPVIVIPSLVSRAYILDLAKGQSLVEYLVGAGFDVYLVDWGTPRREHSGMRLEDYVLRLIPECIEEIVGETGERSISMVGYCMGGQLACMYAATHRDGPLKNLICLTTPVNSEGMHLFREWTAPEHFDLDKVVKELGNIPPELMSASLQALRPLQRPAGQLRLLDKVEDSRFVEGFLRLDRWAADQIPFPGETARQFIVDFLRENKLVRNQMELGGRLVDLSAVRVPFLHVAAEHDHIVPRASSQDLMGLIGSGDKKEIVLKGGHVSMVAGPSAVHRLWPQLDAWLCARSC